MSTIFDVTCFPVFLGHGTSFQAFCQYISSSQHTMFLLLQFVLSISAVDDSLILPLNESCLEAVRQLLQTVDVPTDFSVAGTPCDGVKG